MKKLLEHLGLIYSYSISLQSLRPEEQKRLSYHADYQKWCNISIHRPEAHNTWKQRYRDEDDWIWNYDINFYG